VGFSDLIVNKDVATRLVHATGGASPIGGRHRAIRSIEIAGASLDSGHSSDHFEYRALADERRENGCALRSSV